MPISKIGTNALGNDAINLASATVTGVTQVANGGTGISSPGTAGNVLTSNGTAWVSSAPAGGGGPLVFLSTVTTSTSVSGVTFTGLNSSTYNAFMVEFQGVRPAGDNGQLRVQIGDNSGLFASGHDSSILYSATYIPPSYMSAAGTDYFIVTTASVRSSTAGGCAGIFWIHQSQNATPSFTSDTSWWAPPDGQSFNCRAAGAMQSAYSGYNVNQIRFYFSNGNITGSSKITIYGLKAS